MRQAPLRSYSCCCAFLPRLFACRYVGLQRLLVLEPCQAMLGAGLQPLLPMLQRGFRGALPANCSELSGGALQCERMLIAIDLASTISRSSSATADFVHPNATAGRQG